MLVLHINLHSSADAHFFVFCSIKWKTEIEKYSGTPLMRLALGHKILVVIAMWSH